MVAAIRVVGLLVAAIGVVFLMTSLLPALYIKWLERKIR